LATVSKNIKIVSDKYPKSFVLNTLKKFLSGNMSVGDKETSTLIKDELKDLADALKEIKKNKDEIKKLRSKIQQDSGIVFISIPASDVSSTSIYEYFIFPANDKKTAYKRNIRQKLFRSVFKEIQSKAGALSNEIDSEDVIEKLSDKVIETKNIKSLIDFFIENYVMKFFFAQENPADVIVTPTVSPSKDVQFKITGINIDSSVEKFWRDLKKSHENVKAIKDDKLRGAVGKYILSTTVSK
jgi:hypothetical protein